MPKQERWANKQSLKSANNQLNNGQDILFKLSEKFKEHNSPYYEILKSAILGIEMVKEVVTKMEEEI